MSYVNGFCKIDNGDNVHKCLGRECFREWKSCDDRTALDLSEFGMDGNQTHLFCSECIFKRNCTDDIEECKEASRLQSSTPLPSSDEKEVQS